MNIIQSAFLTIAAILCTSSAIAAPIVITNPDTQNYPNVAIGIQNIDLFGYTYNATIVRGDHSFYDIWDPNQDGDFSDSTIGKAPEFWHNGGFAQHAALQVMNALGNNYKVQGYPYNSDAIFVPTLNVVHPSKVFIYLDDDVRTDTDTPQSIAQWDKATAPGLYLAWVTFTPTPVPEPTSLALLTLATLPLITRRKSKA